MGIDKSLHDQYPSVLINGTRYHFGRELNHGQYLVEHHSYAKDYWCFDKREDMLAFLVNLPESADRDRMRKLFPDWHEVTHEQRGAYLEQGRAMLRRQMQEKQQAGTARRFPVYPDDGIGSFAGKQPFRVEREGNETPVERVERMLRDQKHYHSFDRGLSDAGKLSVLERLDWEGVGAKAKEAILSREVDFTKVTRDALEFVYEDIRDDKEEAPDSSVARKLFDQAMPRGKKTEGVAAPDAWGGFRPATRNLLMSIALDVQPDLPTNVDFGVKTDAHYESLYYPVRNDEISPEQLEKALGNGPMLTELVNAAPSNPHRGIRFETPWDHILPGEGGEDQGGKLTLAALERMAASKAPEAGQEKARGEVNEIERLPAMATDRAGRGDDPGGPAAGGEKRHLTPEARGALVHEAFEAVTAVGFMKWKAEELALGNELTEGDRGLYFQEFEKDHFADFRKMVANASDDRLVGVRDFWVEKAGAMGLSQWQEVLSAGHGARPWYEAIGQEVDSDPRFRQEPQGRGADPRVAKSTEAILGPGGKLDLAELEEQAKAKGKETEQGRPKGKDHGPER